MEAKRRRMESSSQLSQISQNNVHLEFRIWQNMQIAECLDDNYINTLLENTREIIHIQQLQQRHNNHLHEQHNRVENDAINEAIFSYGLKKSSFSSDDDDDDDDDSTDDSNKRQLATSSSPSTSSSSTSSPSSLEDFAINSAIKSYGLQKKKEGGGGEGDSGGGGST